MHGLAPMPDAVGAVSGAAETVLTDIPWHNPTLVVLLSFLSHTALFFLAPIHRSLRPPPPQSPSAAKPGARQRAFSPIIVRNYLVSTFHAVVVCIYILEWFYLYDWDLFSIQRGIGGGRLGTGDEWHSLILEFSLGYFIYDTLCMSYYTETSSLASLVHHLAIGSAFVFGLQYNCCRPYHFYMLLEELSTVPLNVKALWKHNERVNTVSSLMFAGSFVLVRMGYGLAIYGTALMQLPAFLRCCYQHRRYTQCFCALFQLTMCTASRVLNTYWTYLIAKKVLEGLAGKGGAKSRRDRISQQKLLNGE